MSRVYFVARAFPPVLGGIENHNFLLSQWLARDVAATCITNRHGKKGLPLFFLKALVLLVWRARSGDVLVLGDGVLAPLGWLLRQLRGMRVVMVAHGLDVTYANRFYQAVWVRQAMKSMDYIVAVSTATRAELIARGLAAERVLVIPNAVEPGEYRFPLPPASLSMLNGIPVSGRTVLLTIGRLVRRKGVAWFVDNVMPQLDERYIYLVAGDGVELERLGMLVREKGLQERVFLLGRVDEAQKRSLLASASYFVQPNIEVPGDVEGFGIAVIEASACGVMVLASDLQGLRDSVITGQTGDRLPAGAASAWADYLLHNPQPRLRADAISAATIAAFSCKAVSARYRELVLSLS